MAASHSALGMVLGLAMLVLAVSHGAIVVVLLRRRELLRAALALVIPPLGPFFGLEAGARAWAWAWLGSFGSYALALALS